MAELNKITDSQARKIGWLFYRMTQFREDLKISKWDGLKFIYKDLIDDIIKNIILNDK